MSESSVSSLIDIHDSEIIAAEGVLKKLNESSGKPRQMEPFRREIVERFESIGLKVAVKCWSTNVDGVFAFDIEIIDRCEPLRNGFDHDRQAWEVQTALLGIDTPGSFGVDGRLITPPKSTSFITKKD